MAKVLNIRGIDEEVARAFSGGASIRGWTQAEYLKRLLWLHSLVRLDYRGEQWNWKAPEETADAQGDEALWYVTNTPAEEFVDEIGKFLRGNRLLAVTA